MPNHRSLPRSRRLLLLAGGLIAATVIACGGGDDKEPSDATAVTSNGTAVPSAAAGSTPGASTGVTLLADLKSYKYTLTISGNGGPVAGLLGSSGASSFKVTGAYIKPDKQQIVAEVGSITGETIIVGGQQWSRANGVLTGPIATDEYSLRRANPILAFWDGGPLREIIREFNCAGAPSSMNGVQARKCTLDKAGYEKVAKSWGDFLGGLIHQSYSRASAEVWMAQEGFPVRMRLDVAGKDKDGKDFDYKLEMDLSDINGSFEITAPQ